MKQELLDEARAGVRTKMEAKPFDELEKDWMTTLDSMYGLNSIMKIANEERAKQGLDTSKVVIKTIYRVYTHSAIIFFEEFLKMDDEKRSNENQSNEVAL